MTFVLAVDAADRVRDASLLIAMPIAFAAGLISFLSPCVLPLVPGYLSFVTGLSGAQARASGAKRVSWRKSTVFAGASLFILGFSFVFISFGAIFGGFGQMLREHADTLTRVFGVITIFLGLMFTGVFGNVRWLNAEVRSHKLPSAGLLGAPMLGAAFAFGWTPCIGPTLAAVLNLAASSEQASAWRGALLSACYCFGLGLPFLLVGLAFERSTRALAFLRKNARVVMVIGGVLLIMVGVLQVSGAWSWFVDWLQSNVSSPDLPF
ncbi:MAG: cytochrome c biogenesis protein CcdA [Acidimicrobiia bacterium]